MWSKFPKRLCRPLSMPALPTSKIRRLKKFSGGMSRTIEIIYLLSIPNDHLWIRERSRHQKFQLRELLKKFVENMIFSKYLGMKNFKKIIKHIFKGKSKVKKSSNIPQKNFLPQIPATPCTATAPEKCPHM